ncbi:MAG: glycosyltransferase [candidate division Zixibacteria bacterium]|nr:glycosyltransferase [candidate division Zixibacteria bacterium]
MVKADLHLHSKFSERPSEWFLNKLGAAESYTEPETIYQMAKERGMDYVTITDHNRIGGSLELKAKYNDVFTGVEATTYFPGDGCKIHLLIYGLNGDQFDEIQRLRNDIYQLREYVLEQRLAHSVAHATYSVNGKLSMEHLEKLVLMFDVFEGINGGRNKPNNQGWMYFLKSLNKEKINELKKRHGIKPARRDPWVKGFTGGSDDHAGIYIAQTYTLAGAGSIKEFLAQIRDRKTFAEGRSNDYKSLAFTVYKVAHDFSRDRSKPLINAFPLSKLGDLIFEDKKLSFADRMMLAVSKSNAQAGYQKKITEFVDQLSKQKIAASTESNLDLLYDKIAEIVDDMSANLVDSVESNLSNKDVFSVMGNLSGAIPAVFLLAPFFSSFKHLNSNRQLLNRLTADLQPQNERKILWFTDTFNDLNGVSVTLKHLGWEFYAKGVNIQFVTSLLDSENSSDLPPNVINLPQAGTFRLPYYENYIMKVPSLLKTLKILHNVNPDEIFISTPGPIGITGMVMAKLFSIPTTGIYHTDFTLELSEIAKDAESVVNLVESGTRWFYSLMDHIKVPTNAYINILGERGLDKSRMSVFPRHIDMELFSKKDPAEWDGYKVDLPDGLNLLYVGRVSKDKNLEFLIEAYRELRSRKDNINLIVTGDGPYLEEMKKELNGDGRVVFTGRVPSEHLPQIYSQGHALIFPSVTDTFGMVVLEAHCCELPAYVSDQGGPQEIIVDKETGYVLPALHKESWVDSILKLDKMVNENSEEYFRMRQNARSRAAQWASWESLIKGLVDHEPQIKPAHAGDN